MLGLGLAALPQKLLAEVVGFVVETTIVVCIGWHYGSAHVQAQWDEATAKQVIVDAAQNAKNRALEVQLAEAKQEASDARAAAQLQVASTRDAFRADADRVRGQLADSLSGRLASQDSLTACQQRAATAGDLLANGLLVQADLAAAAESHATDLRAVRSYTAAVEAALNASSGASK